VMFAIFLSFILKLSVGASPLFLAVLTSGILINLVLAIFNMLPIPPLDGSRVTMGLLPIDLARRYAKLEPYGFIIIFGLLYLGVIRSVIWPVVMYFSQLLGVSL